MSKKKKPIRILAIAGILILSQLAGVFAASPAVGYSVSYTSKSYDSGGTVHFKVSGQYDGTCTSPGKNPSSGSAPIDQKLDNSHVAVKVIWKYKDWYSKSSSNPDMNGMVYRMCFERLVQYAYGKKYHPDTSDYLNGIIKDMVDAVKNDPTIAVPDTFQVYHVNVSGSGNQDFLFWIEAPPTGRAKVKKVSGNTDITG